MIIQETATGWSTSAFTSLVMLYYIFRARKGTVSSFTLLEYQRGVFFSRGVPLREVGPGKHRVWVGSEKIIWLDVRPSPHNFEQLVVGLRDGRVALYSFVSQIEVVDVRKAIYSGRNPTHWATAALMRAVRSSLHATPSQKIESDPLGVAEAVRSHVQERLAGCGFRLSSFRFSHLALMAPSTPGSEPGSSSAKSRESVQ